MSISLLSVARHKHPTGVILSCFSLCAKFVPKRTIDIQNQYAHIEWEYYKSYLMFIDYLL
jgi:predicted nucleotidyltransferase